MSALPEHPAFDAETVLPEDVPVAMPDLPHSLRVATAEQYKAVGDPTRNRILSIIQNQPATAKQIAQRLGSTPGTIGHHLQVLESAGLAQVVARRLVRGIVAKYYTRTARIFNFEAPEDMNAEEVAPTVDFLGVAREELAEAQATTGGDADCWAGFPHARIAPERVRHYLQRIEALTHDFVDETYDPDGVVYGLSVAFFKSPAYMQGDTAGDTQAKAKRDGKGTHSRKRPARGDEA